MGRLVETRTLRMHVEEAGAGPLVLLCHGFPELSSSWRHQLPALAAAGFHAVAPDLRGYGATDAPASVEAYTMLHLVGDMVALVDALGEPRAAIVGHDWGAHVAWNAALLRPDRFRAVVGMNVPAPRRLPVPPTAAMRQRFGDAYYMLKFQAPGAAEAELERDPRDTLLRVLYYASGDAPAAQRWRPEHGGFFDGTVAPATLPAWIEPAHLDAMAATFARTGFRGGLAWYRNIDRSWELLAPFEGSKIQPPALFVTGDADPGHALSAPAIAGMTAYVPALRDRIVLPGAGHWIGEERPAEVNAALVDFLGSLPD